VIAAQDKVPISKYAKQLVDKLAGEAGAPADFAANYAANVLSKEENVSALRTKVELGEGDAGIVYVTDAAASDKVDTIDIPDAANVLATYAGVVVKGSNEADAHTLSSTGSRVRKGRRSSRSSGSCHHLMADRAPDDRLSARSPCATMRLAA
jgi:ABC-type molybdate transport system substrate-binding protein